MHILVATDGVLDSKEAADAVARWYTDGDSVTVMSVMNIPTEFLGRLGDSGVEEAAHIALEAGQGIGDRAAEQLAKPSKSQEPAVDSPVLKALAKTASDRTKPVVTELAKHGIEAKSSWASSENRTASSILAAIKMNNTELLVMGSHGKGRWEGLLGSTGTKLVRLAPCAVLVLRGEAG